MMENATTIYQNNLEFTSPDLTKLFINVIVGMSASKSSDGRP